MRVFFQSSDAALNTTQTACPLLAEKDYAASSVFQPEALLREARRQKGLPLAPVPEVCVLDPDGDIVRHAKAPAPHIYILAGPVTTRNLSGSIWTVLEKSALSAVPSEPRSPCSWRNSSSHPGASSSSA